jgi:hypothetical protein
MEKGARSSSVVFALIFAAMLIAGCTLFQAPQAPQVPGAGVNSWTLDGQGGVYWSENNYTIRAYPATSNELINHFQLINFSSSNPAGILVNLSFVFDQKPLSGDILLWQNTSHQVQVLYIARQNFTYQISGVSSYAASTSPCQIGDAQNAFNFNVSFSSNGTASSIIACFNSFSNISNNYTLTYAMNATAYSAQTQYWNDWGSILGSFTYTQIAGKHVYTINNVPFNGSTNYQTKFLYSFPLASSGKFSIYAHAGSPAQVVAGMAPVFVELDPWYNTTWGYAIPIDINTTVASNLTNFPGRASLNTSNSTLWNTTSCTNVRFLDSTNTTVLNYDLDSASATYCGNASNNATFFIGGNYTGGALNRIYAYLGNTGATSGENSYAVWSNASYISVWHGNDPSDELGNNNMTASGTIVYANNSSCFIGGCFYFGSTSAYLSKTSPVGAPSGASASFISGWAGKTKAFQNLQAVFSYGAASATHMRTLSGMISSGSFIGSDYYGNGPTGGFVNVTSLGNTSAYGFWASGANGTNVYAQYNSTFVWQSYTPATSAGTFYIGTNTAGGNRQWGYDDSEGVIDELRYTNATRTSDWMVAEYAQSAIIGVVQSYAVAPVINSSSILPAIADTTSTLLGYCNATDAQATNVSYNYTFYLNGAVNATGSYNNTTQGININVGNISSANLAVGQNWTLQCLAYNANGITSALNSSQITIRAIPPPIFIKTAISAYNYTVVNYTFTAIVVNNGTSNLTNVNVSLSMNSTILNSTLANISAGSIFQFSANWSGSRPTTDSNFTATANISNTVFSPGSDAIFMILPIDPPSAIALKGGTVDTKVWIWDGANWVAFTTQLNYRCKNPFPSYCQPVNQNNATGQPIFRDQNNGTVSSAWQAVSTNGTWTTASLLCGTSANPAANTNVSPASTFKNYSTSALAALANNSIYCQFYIESVPADFQRDFSINFTKG